MRPITDYAALSFDCYGTLIDWETGIWDALQPPLMANARIDMRRSDALSVHGRHESSQEAETPNPVGRHSRGRRPTGGRLSPHVDGGDGRGRATRMSGGGSARREINGDVVEVARPRLGLR